MNKFFTLLFLLCFTTLLSHAQAIQPYGVVDMADLTLKDCSFEKGANAMVLFDSEIAVTSEFGIEITRHRRVKILSESGKDLARFRVQYYARDAFHTIDNLRAETINLENGNIVTTKVEPDQIFTEIVDKEHKALVFAFPQVKAGSIIEFTYQFKSRSAANFPAWYFQSKIPTRYSELFATLDHNTRYNLTTTGYQPFAKDSTVKVGDKLGNGERKCWWAKANVPSYQEEAYVTPGVDNFQKLELHLYSLVDFDNDVLRKTDNWKRMAEKMQLFPDFGEQLNRTFPGQDEWLDKARQFKTNDEKIAYLFNKVKSTIAWNKHNDYYTIKGVRPAWQAKQGNCTEINLILFNLLRQLDIKVYPMLLSTHEKGVIDPKIASFDDINVTAVYIPTKDTSRYYVLDASNKYNVYNELPAAFLNTYGVVLDMHNRFAYNDTHVQFLKNETPAKEIVILEGEITPDAKVKGTGQIANYSYNRAHYQKLFNDLGKEKYIERLQAGNGGIVVKDLVMENMEVDSLPMMQQFNFHLNLAAADDNYIYFTPNLFMPAGRNPFISEQRNSDIDFGHCNAFSINGAYKLPAGYKADAMPASTILYMPDKSIIFKRVIGELNGTLQVHYNITYKRSTYSVAEYKGLHDFYKKMYDLLNEPVVFKKI